MTDVLTYFRDMLWHPVAMLLDSQYQTFWPTYIGTAFFAAGVYMWKRRGKPLRLRAIFRYLFPKKIFRHPSTALDLKLYITGAFFIFLQAGLLLSFSTYLNGWQEDILIWMSGHPEPLLDTVPVWYKILFPVIFVLLFELGYWLTHYWMHVIPVLWEYHKVHHSAVVMTPLTELRQHPLELLLFPFVIATTVSPLYALTFWLFGENAEIYYFWSFPFFLIVAFSTIGHLRHSHVKIGANRFWSCVIQTPAHHHIHHSMEPKHFDKNMGFCLAVWDWMFGTLSIPQKGQKIEFGIEDDLKESYSLRDHMIEPIKQSYRVLTNRKKPFSASFFLSQQKKTTDG
ncbi:MAG: sterol desaturase family protein [Alphaproteobacteria bacterium]|nr:sterol desaturase family protein [Alphaproteobacteria bacterium]